MQVKILESNVLVGLLGESYLKNPLPRGSQDAAGYDVMSNVDCVIPARSRALIRTGISIAVPRGCYGRVAPRSGLALKGKDVGAGVIDADYRGEVGVILINNSDEDFTVKPGDRVAQLIIEVILRPDIRVVSEIDETVRGSGGFGSTGI